MGEASEPGPDAGGPQGPEGDGHGEDGHAHPIGEAIAINVAINAILNAISGYGIAWLHWQDYELAWYTHHLHATFETGFVAEDLIVQGASTAVIVTVIVSAILHRQWEHGMLEAARLEAFLVGEERTRGRHMLSWALGTALAGAAFAGLVAAIVTTGDTVSGSTFAWSRTVTGFVVGGAVGGLVTASWVTNLSADKLTRPSGGDTVVARTMSRCHEHAAIALVLVLVATAGLGSGLTELTADVEAHDRMPRGTHHHEGALAIDERFNATHDAGFTLQFSTDRDRCRADNQRHLQARAPEDVACGNITDEVYLRAMDEFFAFLESYRYEADEGPFNGTVNASQRLANPVEAQLGPPSFLELANWTIAGGQGQAPEEAYALPPAVDRGRVNAAERIVEDRLAEARAATVGEEADRARVHYQIDPATELTDQQIGAFVLDAREAYLDWAPENARWDVFTGNNAPAHVVDQPRANAHQASALADDVEHLAPIVAGALAVTLAAVFRNPVAALVAVGTVAAAGAWTFGLLGHVGAPVSELDLVAGGLALAVGTLATVPPIETYLRRTEAGEDAARAIAAAGDRAAFPAYLGGLVAAIGFLVLGLGPTALVADAAWLALWAIVSTLVLAVTLVPATLAATGTRGRMLALDPSRLVDRLHGGLGARSVAVVLLAALTLGGLAGVADLAGDADGDAVSQWPQGDPLRAEHRASVAAFQERSTDEPLLLEAAIVVHGDPAEPATLAYLDRLAGELDAEAADSEVLSTSTSRDLPSAVRDWLEVCCGARGVAERSLVDRLGEEQAEAADRYPQTREEAEATFEAMFASPYARFARPLIANETPNATVQLVQIQGEDGEAAERGWQAVTDALAVVEEPEGVETAVVGPTATTHLTIEDQLAWFGWAMLGLVTMAAVLGFGYTLDPRAALAQALVPGLAAVWVVGGFALADEPFTTGVGLGLLAGSTLAAGFGARAVWARHRGHGGRAAERANLWTFLVAAGMVGVVALAADPSAAVGNRVVEEGLAALAATIGAGHAAALLAPRALLASAPREAEAAEAAGEATS